MNYGEITKCDIANGPGCRTSLFVSGCTHCCKECFNPETWDFGYGEEFTEAVQEQIIGETTPSHIAGLTLLGGEPMEIANQKALRPFLERFKKELPDKTIWIYSGYTWEELNDPDNKRCHSEDTDAILAMTDVLVDGEFKIEKKDISLRFRGSSNQRVIDVPATRESGKIVISEYSER